LLLPLWGKAGKGVKNPKKYKINLNISVIRIAKNYVHKGNYPIRKTV
jgi:hypothetical protein